VYNTTYYWRIDAKNKGGVTTGDTWQFTTVLGGSITGRVIDTAGMGIPNITVKVFTATSAVADVTTTDADGNYTIGMGLKTGNYRVGFFDEAGWYVAVYFRNSVTLGVQQAKQCQEPRLQG
jgi:hypothetical protein